MGILNFFKNKTNNELKTNSTEKVDHTKDKSDDESFNIYYKMFLKAKDLEKENIEEALNIYMEIIDKYNPEGISYYERPAIILEKQKKYKDALIIALEGKNAIDNRNFNANTDYFDKRINRLNIKIQKNTI